MSQAHRDNDNTAYRQARARFKHQGQAQDAPCWICGQPIDYTAPRGNKYSHTLDHLYPASTHPDLFLDEGNWRHAHHGCNARRGAANMTRACLDLPRWW